MSILTLCSGLFLENLIILSHTPSASTAKSIPMLLVAVVALLGVFVVLNMPLRDPNLPSEDISPPFTTPTVKLRTPEDNLTPWQYMTVSWMSPLIQKGMTRKLDDEDVWDLGWEFKHARLHSAFRVLQGSVTKRLLLANGMDLIRTTSLAVLQLAASTCLSTHLYRGGPEWAHLIILRAFADISSSSANTCPSTAASSLHEGSGIELKSHPYICGPFSPPSDDIRSVQCLQSVVPTTSI